MASEDETRPDGSTHARTRAEPCTPQVKRERIAHIVGMMERLEWRTGESGPELAEKWGLSEQTLKGYAAEASRLVIGDPDEARRDITAGCRKLFRDAVSEGDAKSARAVGELWASVSGAKAPDRVEATVAAVGLDDLEALRKTAEANECSESEPNSDSEPSS